jgi:hypothetical protein
VKPWQWTDHARGRAREMGLDERTVVAVLDDPDASYPSRKSDNCHVAVGQGLAVVHRPKRRTVVTILWDQEESR